jgi:hypothetical protein
MNHGYLINNTGLIHCSPYNKYSCLGGHLQMVLIVDHVWNYWFRWSGLFMAPRFQESTVQLHSQPTPQKNKRFQVLMAVKMSVLVL